VGKCVSEARSLTMSKEEVRRFIEEVVEPVVKETYGIGVRDALSRMDAMNKELGEVKRGLEEISKRVESLDRKVDTHVDMLNKRVDSLDRNVGILNERTKIMLNIQYALIGGTFGTLVGIILMLVRLLP